MKWIHYTRPFIWCDFLNEWSHTKKNITLLNRVKRLANTLITGALPSTPGNAMNISNGIVPIENWIEEKVLKGALRLKANGHWI